MKKVHPLFILFFLWFAFTGNLYVFFLYFLAVILHELGHYFVAKILGYKLDKFFLMPHGVSLNYKERVFSTDDEVLIAAAGPMVNISICTIIIAIWWIFPVTYSYTIDFVFYNIVLATFNLLPAYPLDGGRVFISVMSKVMDRQKAYKISAMFNVILSILFVVLFICSCFFSINFTFILAAIFILGGLMDTKLEGKYERMSFSSRANLKKGAGVKSIAVSSDVPIWKISKKLSKTKFNIIYIIFPDGKTKMLNDESFTNILMKISMDKTFEDILK